MNLFSVLGCDFRFHPAERGRWYGLREGTYVEWKIFNVGIQSLPLTAYLICPSPAQQAHIPTFITLRRVREVRP